MNNSSLTRGFSFAFFPGRFGALFFVAMLFGFNLTALAQKQNLQIPTFSTWLCPENASSEATDFIGNYRVFAPNNAAVLAAFKDIAKRNSGTLFVVGIFPSKSNFITFGKVSISAESATAGQHELTYDNIAQKPSILKLSYTISPKFKKEDFEIFVDESVLIAEIIFIKSTPDQETTRMIESYLAAKYSINISANTENELRHYLTTDANKVWDYPTDALYDDEILALGRNDAFHLEQTQTFSSDAERIKLSFAEGAPLGDMPPTELTDQSLLVLSKKKDAYISAFCGGSQFKQPWKLHFYNWQKTNPETAFLWVDSIIDFASPPMLGNGTEMITLLYKTVDNGTQIELPLAKLDVNQDYFIVFQSLEKNCVSLGKLVVTDCNKQTNEPTLLQVELSEEGLDATVFLVNQSTGEQYTFELQNSIGTISGLPEGMYEVLVTNKEGTLINELVNIQNCGMPTSGSVQFNQQGQSTNPIVQNQTQGQGITAFPNPVHDENVVQFAFWGFAEADFSIQITDAQGKIIHQTSHKVNEGSAPFSFSFHTPGIYNVTLTTQGYTEVKRIVVQ